MRELLSVLALFLFAAGCGDDATGPANANVAGTWNAAWTNMSGEGAVVA